VLLGGFAGIIATLVAEANLFALYKQVIHIDYHPSYYLWIAVPLCGIIGVSFAGFWGVRSVVKHAPLPILRRLQ
jgi:putative ABC transport system permease protein